MTRSSSQGPLMVYRWHTLWCIAADGRVLATFRDEIEAVVWALALAERKRRTVTYVGVPSQAASLGKAEYATRKKNGTAPLPLKKERRF